MRLLPGIAVLFTALLAIPFAECQQQNAALQLPQVTGLPPAASAAAASIDPAKISAHVRFLSGSKNGIGVVAIRTVVLWWLTASSSRSSVPAAARSGRTRAMPMWRWRTGE